MYVQRLYYQVMTASVEHVAQWGRHGELRTTYGCSTVVLMYLRSGTKIVEVVAVTIDGSFVVFSFFFR